MHSSRVAASAAVLLVLVASCGATTSGPQPLAKTRTPAAKEFQPSDTNRDPTSKIDGVLSVEFAGGNHVTAPTRVRYEQTPPIGGRHDGYWAACNGVVYPKAVRSENLVHSLEHGAVWITYDPERVQDAELGTLVGLVDGKPYLVLSPYPGQEKPVSVQSWGRQLAVEDPWDKRIDQFVAATRVNRYLSPEPGASCDALGAPQFDQDNPPPFDPSPPGPDAVPATGD